MKKAIDIEFSASLFDKCNLGCAFCFSKFADNKVDNDKIRNIPNEVINTLLKDINCNSAPKHLVVRSWGGELFADDISDETFEAYKDYILLLDKLIKENAKCNIDDIEYRWLSNGVFTKRERVKKLLEETNSRISFSYDAIHRFHNDSQKDIWLESIKYFYDLLDSIGITFTKPNIDAIMKGDRWFNEVVKMDCHIDGNYYWANRNWEYFMPSEEDLFNFFVWCCENCPQLNFLPDFVKPSENKKAPKSCICNHTIQYYNGKCSKDCVRRTSCLDPELFYGEDNNKTLEDEENCFQIKIDRFENIKRCLLCEYYNLCGAGCPGSMIFKHFKHSKDCMYKRLFEYLKQHPELRELIKSKDND